MKPSKAAWDRILESFAVEHRDHLAHLHTLSGELAQGSWPESVGAEAQRSLHNLKGACRMLNFSPIEELCHRGETLLLKIQTSPDPDLSQEADWVYRLHNALEDGIAAALQGRPTSPLVEEVYAGLGEWLQLEGDSPLQPSQESEGNSTTQVVRVGVEQLENLIRATGPVGTQPYQMQECLKRLRQQAPASLRPLLGSLERLTRELVKTSQDFREQARQLLLVSARDILGGLGSQARELAAQAGKEVDFLFEGAEVMVELPLLQALLDPLNHLLANAVHHGLESSQERRQAGKPERGSIRLQLVRRREELLLFFADDGRGLQNEVLRERARALGHDPTLPSQELVFLDALSSLVQADRVAGRGIGMGLVKTRVRELGGRMRLLPSAAGTSWELRFISGAWGMEVLTVRCEEQAFALPTRAVKRMRYIAASQLVGSADQRFLIQEGASLAVVSLAQLLGLPCRQENDEQLRLVELEDGQGQCRLLQVDDWLGTQSVMLQAVQGGGWPENLLEGAYLSAAGEACLVLNAEYLLHGAFAPRQLPAVRSPLILLVDDSQTTRQITAALLNTYGYRTVQANDGLEALSVLASQPVNLVISDIQMPNLDGLALVEQIRSQNLPAHLPVILLTSLAKPAEQRRGMQSGADAYLLKQSFDHRALVETVQRLL